MSNIEFDRELDLRGEVCPFTFVKSKLILEQMNIGETLKIILDYKPSAENVPKSMKDEYQDVLEVKQVGDNLWEIYVRKAR